jgi:hypothetical protein
LSTVPITEAMQITVSSEIENRIDDSSSTHERRCAVGARRPAVDGHGRRSEEKRRALLRGARPFGVFVGG